MPGVEFVLLLNMKPLVILK